MFLFQTPPPTRYDLNFTIAGFPVRVHPLFWVVALLLGAASSNILEILLWVVAIFVSILIHELGHAVAFRRYGQRSHIVLHFAGGLTVPEQVSWGSGWANVSPSPNQQIVISLAGPFAEFLFSGLVTIGMILLGVKIQFYLWLGFIPIPQPVSFSNVGNLIALFIGILLWVNIVYGVFNLLPIFPLDGGQVARNVFMQYDPWDGVRKSLWVSVIVSGLLAMVELLSINMLMALLFGFLAFQSYQSLQGRY